MKVPDSPSAGRRVAWVRIQRPDPGCFTPRGVEVFWLGEDHNLTTAGHELYDLLRRLDGMGFEKIWCEAATEAGLGLALNDRLRRAAGRG